jgi:hypothetical protein
MFCINYSDVVFAVRDRARKRGGSANWRGKGWRRRRERDWKENFELKKLESGRLYRRRLLGKLGELKELST